MAVTGARRSLGEVGRQRFSGSGYRTDKNQPSVVVVGLGMRDQLVSLLGRDRCLARLDRALAAALEAGSGPFACSLCAPAGKGGILFYDACRVVGPSEPQGSAP
jgi:hypothetical protein